MTNCFNNLYEFDRFRLDCAERMLWRGAEHISLPPKVFDVLCLLVERQGSIVSKSELMNAVWAETFVEESNLSQNIYTLRRVLGKNENGQDFIETVPRRGYRFAIPAQLVSESRADKYIEANSIAKNNGAPDIQIIPDVSAATFPAERETVVVNSQNTYRWFLFGIFGIVIAGLIGFRIYPVQNNKSSISPIENVSIQKLTSTGDSAFHVISPDGKSIAYVREISLYVQDVESEKHTRLDVPNANNFAFIRFSSDGESLYYRNQKSTDLPGTVFRVSRFGGVPIPVFNNVWSAFSFSPDGKRAAFFRFDPAANEHTLIIRTIDSGQEHALLTRKLPDSFHNSGQPAWSPDGKLLAVIARSPQLPVWQIIVAEINNGTTQVIEPLRVVAISQLAWMPDGKSLIASAREKDKVYQLWRIGFPDGEINRLTNDLNVYLGVSLSANGKRLVSSQYSSFSHIWTAPANQLEDQRQVTFGNQNRDGVNGVTWTPDGNIVYVARTMGDLDLWKLRPGDGSRERLTQNAGIANLNPVISNDNRYIYFNSTRTHGSHIWRTDINGENPTQLTDSNVETEFFPNLSPDGNWLYYVQRGANSSGVWRQSISDGTRQRLTAPETAAPNNFLTLSPNGKLLAFHNLTKTIEEEAGAQVFQIGVISAESQNEPKFYNIHASRSNVRWSSDSKSFDYIENFQDDPKSKLWRQPLDPQTSPALLLTLPIEHISNFAWSPDGKQFAIARGQDQNDAVLLTNF